MRFPYSAVLPSIACITCGYVREDDMMRRCQGYVTVSGPVSVGWQFANDRRWHMGREWEWDRPDPDAKVWRIVSFILTPRNLSNGTVNQMKDQRQSMQEIIIINGQWENTSNVFPTMRIPVIDNPSYWCMSMLFMRATTLKTMFGRLRAQASPLLSPVCRLLLSSCSSWAPLGWTVNISINGSAIQQLMSRHGMYRNRCKHRW